MFLPEFERGELEKGLSHFLLFKSQPRSNESVDICKRFRSFRDSVFRTTALADL